MARKSNPAKPAAKGPAKKKSTARAQAPAAKKKTAGAKKKKPLAPKRTRGILKDTPAGSLTINIPIADSKAQVLCQSGQTTGSICAEGQVTPPDGLKVVEVVAKIYPGDTDPSTIPTNPMKVTGLTTGMIDQLPNWRFTDADGDLIPNAAAAPAAPFPANILAVWAQWSSDPATYCLTLQTFYGLVSTQTDCD